MVWFDISEGEDWEYLSVKVVLSQTSKHWRSLFNSYSNLKFKAVLDKGSFDGLKQILETISIADINKMMKDFKLYPRILSKDEIMSILKNVNYHS